MFQFPPFAPASLVTGLQPAGLPHSEITGSIHVCSSPVLIAAYHVLHRLQKPRHPPFALVTFSLNEFSLNHKPSATLFTLDLTFTRCLEIAVHNILPIHIGDDRLSIIFCYRLINFYLLTLPRYLFSNLSINCHLSYVCFSNGLQRYGLFLNLQIFLQYFCKNFQTFFKQKSQNTENEAINKKAIFSRFLSLILSIGRRSRIKCGMT